MSERREMILADKSLPIIKKQDLLNLPGSTFYYRPREKETFDDEFLELLKLIDQLHIKYPSFGTRRLRDQLQRSGHLIGRDKVRTLMGIIGIRVQYPKPRTSIKMKGHKIYPYLLRDLKIVRPNQVWATDITYIPMSKGFVYLVAIMDIYSRKILSWRISNSMDTRFCLEALEAAIREYGCPEIFNSDQGSQFTSDEFTEALKAHGIQISMDGKGRWVDNVFIERFWRTLKYDEVYLKAYESTSEARTCIGDFIDFYNSGMPHSSLKKKTPDEVYFKTSKKDNAA